MIAWLNYPANASENEKKPEKEETIYKNGIVRGTIVEITYRDIILKTKETHSDQPCTSKNGNFRVAYNTGSNINPDTNLQIATTGSTLMFHLTILDAAKAHRPVEIWYGTSHGRCILIDYGVSY